MAPIVETAKILVILAAATLGVWAVGHFIFGAW
jgi:hypothetical protein